LINMELIFGNDVTPMVEELLNKKCRDIIAWWYPCLMSNVDLPKKIWSFNHYSIVHGIYYLFLAIKLIVSLHHVLVVTKISYLQHKSRKKVRYHIHLKAKHIQLKLYYQL
jgi:hypothetical protein